MLGMKLTLLISPEPRVFIWEHMEREKGGNTVFYIYLKRLSSSWVLGLTGSVPVVPRDPAVPRCLSLSLICSIHPGLMGMSWLSFPALVKIHREVGNGFMIKAELDLCQRSFPSWKSEPLENSLDPRGRLLNCPRRLAWKEKGAGSQIGRPFNVISPEQHVWPQASVCMLHFHWSAACLVTVKTGMVKKENRNSSHGLNIANEETTTTGMTRSSIHYRKVRILCLGWKLFRELERWLNG